MTEGKSTRQEIARLQLAMTPDWIGRLTLLEWFCALVAVVTLFIGFRWWALGCFGVLYLLGIFAGFVGLIIPLMPYAWNLNAVLKHLERSRMSLMLGKQLPSGATTDITESFQLSHLAETLREAFGDGKMSVERCATGLLEEALLEMRLRGR
jgi:hypothetical protein